LLERASNEDIINRSARAAYKDERHPKLSTSKFFHAALYKPNFNNIQYVLTMGGNAFYKKCRLQNVTR